MIAPTVNTDLMNTFLEGGGLLAWTPGFARSGRGDRLSGLRGPSPTAFHQGGNHPFCPSPAIEGCEPRLLPQDAMGRANNLATASKLASDFRKQLALVQAMTNGR